MHWWHNKGIRGLLNSYFIRACRKRKALLVWIFLGFPVARAYAISSTYSMEILQFGIMGRSLQYPQEGNKSGLYRCSTAGYRALLSPLFSGHQQCRTDLEHFGDRLHRLRSASRRSIVGPVASQASHKVHRQVPGFPDWPSFKRDRSIGRICTWRPADKGRPL